MSQREIDELLLDVCQPSELGRRDAAVSGDGASSELRDAKQAVAAVGVAVDGPPPPSGLRERLLASFERGGRYGRYADRIARMFDLKLEDAERLLARVEDPSAWTPFLVPGVDALPVELGPRFSGAMGVIARIPPGVRFPEHVHRGEETMFVLDGGFREEGEGGAEIWRGDERVSKDASSHAFVALPGVPCIAASLVEGVIDFC